MNWLTQVQLVCLIKGHITITVQRQPTKQTPITNAFLQELSGAMGWLNTQDGQEVDLQR